MQLVPRSMIWVTGFLAWALGGLLLKENIMTRDLVAAIIQKHDTPKLIDAVWNDLWIVWNTTDRDGQKLYMIKKPDVTWTSIPLDLLIKALAADKVQSNVKEPQVAQ